MADRSEEVLDCLIIGGGPAGLTAALYLGRFRRNCLLVDAGKSRAARIPVSHNMAGFPEGITGEAYLARLRDQAERYGARIERGEVMRIARREETDGGGFEIRIDSAQAGTGQPDREQGDETRPIVGERILVARNILLATGMTDEEPELPYLRQALRRGILRYCPICDGYEVIGKKVCVVGEGEKGAEEALFVRNYSDDVTLMTQGDPLDLREDVRERLRLAGIAVVRDPAEEIVLDGNEIRAVVAGKGETWTFDAIYAALGSNPRSALASSLGAAMDEGGCIKVDTHQQTSVPGLYAAGDVVVGLAQVSVATGHAAIAATAIHNGLRVREGMSLKTQRARQDAA